MKHLWGGLLVLSLSAFMPESAVAQGSTSQTGRGRGAGLELGQNFPNPVNPDTRIPFTVGESATCADPSRLHKVSLRIYNVVAQLVAVPILQGTGNVAGGEPLENLYLTCNQYIAYWDGKYMTTQQQAAAGVYLYRLEVDGKAVVKKMLVSK